MGMHTAVCAYYRVCLLLAPAPPCLCIGMPLQAAVERSEEASARMEATKQAPKGWLPDPACTKQSTKGCSSGRSVEAEELKDPERLIHEAFARNDVELSIMAHQARLQQQQTVGGSLPEGGHNQRERDFSSHLIMGGCMGVLTSMAMVGGAHGAGIPNEMIMMLGVGVVCAASVGTGLTHFLLDREEICHYKRERKREEWELEHFRAGERMEMIELYVSKGLPVTEAEKLIDTMIPYKDVFLDHMMVVELGLMPHGKEYSVLKGMVAFVSMLAFGLLPLLPFFSSFRPSWANPLDENLAPVASVAAGMLGLIILGVFKVKMMERASLLTCVGWMLVQGIVALGLSVAVAMGLKEAMLVAP